MNQTRNTRGILCIVLSALGFAVMAACVRLCDDFGPAIPCFEKGLFRNLIAFLIAVAAFALGKSRKADERNAPMTMKAWWILLLRSAVGTMGIFCNFYALSHIPIADGQTLNKTAPFFTVVFAWAFLGERVSARQLIAVGVAFAGAALVAKPGFAGDGAFPLAMGLLGGVAAGAAYAAVRALGAMKVRPTLIVLFFSAFSCLAAIPFTWAMYVPLAWKQLLILAGAGLGAALGQFGITLAYRFAAPKDIAVYDYSNIIFTAGLGYLLFGQVSDFLAVAGMVVIVAAAMILNLRKA